MFDADATYSLPETSPLQATRSSAYLVVDPITTGTLM
jgi:hypothetical protein